MSQFLKANFKLPYPFLKDDNGFLCKLRFVDVSVDIINLHA